MAGQELDLMKHPVISILILVAFVGCGRKQPSWQTRIQQSDLSAAQFTEIVADAARATLPGAQVEILDSLKLNVSAETGDCVCHLDNAWQECRSNETTRVEVVTRHLHTMESAFQSAAHKHVVDINKIVPMLKSILWIDECKRQGLSIYHEQLAADVYVVYAEDGADQFAFVNEETFQSFGLSPVQLRRKSLANLAARLPEPERHGEGPLYMLVAGGTYEASLLLVDDVWENQDPAVDGRMVVAVPARDLVLFTGENATEAVQQMETIVDDIHSDGNYLISRTTFVREGNQWLPLQSE